MQINGKGPLSTSTSDEDATTIIPGAFNISLITQYDDNTSFSLPDVQAALRAHYGPRITEWVENSNFGYNPNLKEISVAEIKMRIAYIALYVDKQTLQDAFVMLTKACFPDFQIPDKSKVLGCFAHFSEEEIRKLCTTLHFDELDEEQVQLLYRAFQQLPNDNNELRPVVEVLYGDVSKENCRSLTNNAEFNNVLVSLKALNLCENYQQPEEADPLKKKLAASEFFARQLAYGLAFHPEALKDLKLFKRNKSLTPDQIQSHLELLLAESIVGMIFTGLDANGQKILLVVKSCLYHDGLVCYFCTPLTNGQSEQSPFDYPVYIFARGTYCPDSQGRDLEASEIGRKSFNALRESIRNALARIIPSFAAGVKVSLTGHSLGAVDAMRILAMIIEHLFKRTQSLDLKESPLDLIHSLELITWNSPRLDSKTAKTASQQYRAIKEQNLFPLEVKVTHCIVEYDPFQNWFPTGSLLGWNPPLKGQRSRQSPWPGTQLVRIKRQEPLTSPFISLKAHSSSCLDTTLPYPPKMKVVTEKINKYLGPRTIFEIVILFLNGLRKRLQLIPIHFYHIVKRILLPCANKLTNKTHRTAVQRFKPRPLPRMIRV